MVEQTVRTFCKRLLLFVGPLLAVGALRHRLDLDG